ncbi:hypothetical protein HanIR_Chr04g0205851 [Helianthus annuus]|nr:hypothetical protein HanIR_Chr04g0205851 [Helianthus annuus]
MLLIHVKRILLIIYSCKKDIINILLMKDIMLSRVRICLVLFLIHVELYDNIG